MLLAHGANTRTRDSECGPVAWAAHHKNWRALLLLIEHGADWQHEEVFGSAVSQLVASRVLELEHATQSIPEDLREVAARYDGVLK